MRYCTGTLRIISTVLIFRKDGGDSIKKMKRKERFPVMALSNDFTCNLSNSTMTRDKVLQFQVCLQCWCSSELRLISEFHFRFSIHTLTVVPGKDTCTIIG